MNKLFIYQIDFGSKGETRYFTSEFSKEETIILAQASQIRDGLPYKDYTVSEIHED